MTVQFSLIVGGAVSWQAAPSGCTHCINDRTGHRPVQVYLTLKEGDQYVRYKKTENNFNVDDAKGHCLEVTKGVRRSS